MVDAFFPHSIIKHTMLFYILKQFFSHGIKSAWQIESNTWAGEILVYRLN